ncbi:MAG: hypothetical protein LBL59_01340 [Xanthomonadaceae bacterium]|jgi:hypothetical protein|nr:hypothetical protein [Xanthomonadaceae bacterium]
MSTDKPPLVELPRDLHWLNSPTYTLAECKGVPVALVFVNAASVWSMQRLDELAIWQARNPGRLHVFVLHVPRFDIEHDRQYVLKMLRRSGVALPFVQDAGWQAWRQYGVSSWPTVLLIDREGREKERLVGLGDELDPRLAALVGPARASGHWETLPFRESDPETEESMLKFPAGIAASPQRLYIADSGHHRILECTYDGRVRRQFGMGTAGFQDGPMHVASFHRPWALAVDRDVLYVCDASNHALRRISLNSGEVSTVCGTGHAGRPVEGLVVSPSKSSLYYPHGLAAANNQLYFAMTGDNQIWRYDLGQRQLHREAGSGRLELNDGSAMLAAFAQPVDVVVVQRTLYVCDALGSAVRLVQLQNRQVQTLVGKHLWEFGCQDGSRAEALMQYPQAIVHSSDSPLLWIADAGNQRLRTLRLGGGMLSTVNLPRPLSIPLGLAGTAGVVWIAEAGANRISRYGIASGELQEIEIIE